MGRLELVPPTAGVFDTPAVCISLNAEWVDALMTAVERLEYASTWVEGTDMDHVRGEVNKLTDYLADIFNGSCNVGQPPFWESENGADADNETDYYPWYDQLGDWFISAFLSSTFTPLAGILYKTVLVNLRLAIRRQEYGAIFKILINGLEIATGDSYSPISDLMEVDLDIGAFAAANGLGAPPYDMEIIHTGTHNPSATPAAQGYAIEVIRKRLSEEEVTAITDIRQVGGQMEVVRGNSGVWENVPNADNVRRDGSTVITGQQQFRTGSAGAALLRMNPNAGEGIMRVQLPVTSTVPILEVLNSAGTNIFNINSAGRFQGRGTDNQQFTFRNASGELMIAFATTGDNPILNLMQIAGKNGNFLSATSPTGVLMAALGSTGALRGRGALTLYGSSSVQEREQAAFGAYWAQSNEATRRGAFKVTVYDFNGAHDLIQGSMAVDLSGTPYPALAFFDGMGGTRETIAGTYAANSPFSQTLNALTQLGLINNTSNAVTPIAVSGERQQNAALTSLISALVTYGWITDATTAGSAPSGYGSRTYFLSPTLPFTQITTAWNTISGQVYTLDVSGFITIDGGTRAMDACWNFVGGTWTNTNPVFGCFKINGTGQNGARGYASDSTYTFSIVGNGSPIVIRAENFGPGTNTGGLTVGISGNGVS